jgi:Bacterial toxin homologue of phage lysozyme, C-term
MRALTMDEVECVGGGLLIVLPIPGTRMTEPTVPASPLSASSDLMWWSGSVNGGFASQDAQLQCYADWLNAGSPDIQGQSAPDYLEEVKVTAQRVGIDENLGEVVVTTTMVPKISYAEIPMLQFSADDWLCQFGGPAFSVPIEYEQIETVTINGRDYHVAASKIFEHEGPLKLSPTPTAVEHHLTVGHGFDLTEHNKTDLKNMGVSKELIDKLEPYLGKTGDAKDLPKELLRISTAEATLLSNIVLASIIEKVEQIYETKSGRQFEALPANVQTVVVDLAYMCGPNGFPNFMTDVVNFNPISPDYTAMKNELNHFWGPNVDQKLLEGLNNRVADDLRILLPTGP